MEGKLINIEQLSFITVDKLPRNLPKYKGHPGKMCAECKDIFSVDHPSGNRKFYCRKQIANNIVGHKVIRKYSPSCFMFRPGENVIQRFFRSGFSKLSEKKFGVPRLTPKRWKNKGELN